MNRWRSDLFTLPLGVLPRSVIVVGCGLVERPGGVARTAALAMITIALAVAGFTLYERPMLSSRPATKPYYPCESPSERKTTTRSNGVHDAQTGAEVLIIDCALNGRTPGSLRRAQIQGSNLLSAKHVENLVGLRPPPISKFLLQSRSSNRLSFWGREMLKRLPH